MDCIFCKIAQKEIVSSVVYENDSVVVFPDIRPKAALHFLIVPKKHVESLSDARSEHRELLGELLLAAQAVAQERGIKGYKLQMNVGKEGGQQIDHLHLHFLVPPINVLYGI